ncbi:uncharacterized protein LOC111693281, partial [Trichogramma pretiosum]|uniref:uncharacterized protein LOC111693281 n=1 Tax=Trichogramma pretiosum TaxID=7493 RepID=UPI000C71B11E
MYMLENQCKSKTYLEHDEELRKAREGCDVVEECQLRNLEFLNRERCYVFRCRVDGRANLKRLELSCVPQVKIVLIALSGLINKNVPGHELVEATVYSGFLLCVLSIYALSFDDKLIAASSIMMEIWKEFREEDERSIIIEKLRQGFTISMLYSVIMYTIFVGCSLQPEVKYRAISWISVNKTIEKDLFFPIYFTKQLKDNYYLALFVFVLGGLMLGTILSIFNYFQTTLWKFIVASLLLIGLLNVLQLFAQQKYFIVIIVIIIELTLAGFWFLYVISYDKNYALKTVVWMIVAICNLFYIIHPGQELINANNRLWGGCCNCKWYIFPAKERQLILLMMIRTSKPFLLTAGPIIPMSYETSAR